VGRKSRRVTTALHRALKARDRTCVFPGCTHRGREVHHIRHWADGGTTDQANTCLLCSAHHARVHEGEIALTGRAPDGLVFRTPAGYPVAGAPHSLPADPVAALIERHEEDGLEITPRTNAIDWWGEPLDAYWAVTALQLKDRASPTA